MTLPVQTQAVADERGLLTPTWRRWLADLERRVSSSQNDALAADIAAIATALGSPDGTVGNIPEQASTDALIVGLDGILTEGRLSSGRVTVRLVDLEDTGEGAGLVKITRDDKGRVEGTEAATTSDLPEGSNLYYTDTRADARVAAGIAAHVAASDPHTQYILDSEKGTNVATLVGGKLDPGQLPALAITETFVVASQAAMLALVCQQGDVAVRTDLNKSFILTADPASTLANWQELLTPSGGVTSFNGRTGSVVPASGDYTYAQVASKPTTVSGLSLTDLASGTYTPTLTNVTNITSSTTDVFQWLRVGNTVTVSGVITIDPTTANTASRLAISLPIASDIAGFTDCAGVGAMAPTNTGGVSGAIAGDATNNRADLYFCTGAEVQSRSWGIHFTYTIK